MSDFPKLVRGPRGGESFPFFAAIEVGPWTVSIQASRTSYSTPRENFASADEYSAFEVAAWPTATPDKWLQPRNYPKLATFADLFEDRISHPVAGYVPRDVVADLVAALANVDPVADRTVIDAELGQ